MKRLTPCLWVLAGLLISPLASAQTAPRAEQFPLSNGTTLIVQPDRPAPPAVHLLWARVGTATE